VTLNDDGSGAARQRIIFSLGFALLLTIAVLAIGLGSNAGFSQATVSSSLPAFPAPTTSHLAATPKSLSLARLPLIFEPNEGQTATQVKFLAHGAGYGVFLTKDSLVLSMPRSGSGVHSRTKRDVIRMALEGANKNAAVLGSRQLPGRSNYFIGSSPAQWHRDIPQFVRVSYENVYPGIDLVYYGNQGRLEYDFEVAPGAEAKQIALRFEISRKLKLDSQGNLLLGGSARLEAPRIYQKFEEEERPVTGRFVLRDNRVSFEIGDYDRSRALIIDPTLVGGFSTFLGGSADEACSVILGSASPPPACPAVAVDPALNIYIAGSTTSTDFPPAGSPLQASNAGGGGDVFIAKLDPTGSTLLFSTYLGGTGRDTPAGIGVDSAANVAVAGTTDSSDFPTSPSPFQGPQSGTHVFVSEVDSAGHTLLYSTYLASGGIDSASGLAEDVRGKLYITGTTSSSSFPPATANFPTTVGSFQPAPLAANQSFMSKIDPTLLGSSSLVYSTYFGGGNPPNGTTIGGGIAVDQNNNVYITGGTNFLHVGNTSSDFPILNAYQSCLNVPPPSSSTTPPPNCTPTPGPTDAFLAKFNLTAASRAQLLYSTYFGGAGNDVGTAVAVDTANAYITGSTTSSDFVIPTGTTPFQKCLDDPSNPATCPAASASDAFLAKFGTPSTSSTTTSNVPLVYFSYLGGSGTDVGLGIAVDSFQGARITGWTNSGDFPLGGGKTGSATGGTPDAFISRIDTTATSSTAAGHFGILLGGGASDFGTSIATDSQSNTYVVGETASNNFPRQSPFQSNLMGKTDAFVAKFVPTVSFCLTSSSSGSCMNAAAPTVSPTVVGVGNQVTFKYTVTNVGDPVSGVTLTDLLPSSTLATFVSATTAGGSAGNGCSAPVNQTVQCNLGTINAAAVPTVTVILTPVAPTPPNNSSTSLSNNAQVSVNGVGTVNAPTLSATVNDFQVSVAPPTATVSAGTPATYTVTVGPTGSIPNTISLSCSSTLPTGATCTFPNGASVSNLNNGSAVSRTLVINTTARVTTPASLWKRGGPLYAIWFPLPGLALLGVGVSNKITRKSRTLLVVLLAGFIALIAGCGSSRSTSVTTGTPAGTYPLTITGTSGTATRTFPIELVVK
jgi:uncharacterized repeat protein (TIGR01451 family)